MTEQQELMALYKSGPQQPSTQQWGSKSRALEASSACSNEAIVFSRGLNHTSDPLCVSSAAEETGK